MQMKWYEKITFTRYDWEWKGSPGDVIDIEIIYFFNVQFSCGKPSSLIHRFDVMSQTGGINVKLLIYFRKKLFPYLKALLIVVMLTHGENWTQRFVENSMKRFENQEQIRMMHLRQTALNNRCCKFFLHQNCFFFLIFAFVQHCTITALLQCVN